MEHRQERQARNEAFIREANERIAKMDEEAASGSEKELFAFMCECGRSGGCVATVQMTLAEYEAARAQDDRFVLQPGHETESLENVVERSERYVIVDKIADAQPFVEDDPRGAPSH
jgi:hypothetical protein